MVQRMTIAEFRKSRGGKGPSREARTPKVNKYRAEKVTVHGITFDSKREAARYQELRLLERAGAITDLQLQVAIPLMGRDGPLKGISGRALTYRADFTYFETASSRNVVEDCKGFKTRDYLLKRSILAAQGIEVMET